MKYIVTLPDGTTKTRNSHRTYTHAVAVRRGDDWSVTSFCGSLALAMAARDRTQSAEERCAAHPAFANYEPPDEYQIMRVAVEEASGTSSRRKS